MKKYLSEGFSLIEVLVIISIFGIILSLSFSSFRSFNSAFQLLSLTKQLTADLRFTQQGSFSFDKFYSISFTQNSYKIYTTQGAQEKKFKEVNLPSNFQITTNFSDNTLSFSAEGNPNRAGSIELSNAKGKSRKIYVSNIGRIRFE